MANYFGILKSDLIEDKSNRSTIIKNRAEALCKEKGISLEKMAADLNIDLNVLKEFDKKDMKNLPSERIRGELIIAHITHTKRKRAMFLRLILHIESIFSQKPTVVVVVNSESYFDLLLCLSRS